MDARRVVEGRGDVMRCSDARAGHCAERLRLELTADLSMLRIFQSGGDLILRCV